MLDLSEGDWRRRAHHLLPLIPPSFYWCSLIQSKSGQNILLTTVWFYHKSSTGGGAGIIFPHHPVLLQKQLFLWCFYVLSTEKLLPYLQNIKILAIVFAHNIKKLAPLHSSLHQACNSMYLTVADTSTLLCSSEEKEKTIQQSTDFIRNRQIKFKQTRNSGSAEKLQSVYSFMS